MLEHAFRTKDLHSLKARNTFDQVGIFLGSQPRSLFNRLLERLLNIEAVSDQNQHGNNGHHHHGTGKDPDNKEEEDGEGEINQR